MNTEAIAALAKRLEPETAIHRQELEKYRTHDARAAIRDAKHFQLRIREVVSHCASLSGAAGTVRHERERWHDMLLRESRRFFEDWALICELESDEA